MNEPQMRRAFLCIFIVSILCCSALGQRGVKRSTSKPAEGNRAIIIDERLSVVRKEPGFYTEFVKRLRMGTPVTVFEEKETDGVIFYKIADATATSGWIQGQAFTGTFRKNDDLILVSLISSSNGFTQIHRASIFLDVFRDSPLRPNVLLLFGDLIEVAADEISTEATNTLVRREVAATRAPIHSFYLNYKSLDEYYRLGVSFVFNAKTRKLHYNGASWEEILERFPESEQSIEARKRIADILEKLRQE